MKKEKRITISDIARISGYSKTAVSFAFNSPEKIGADACKHILNVAKELDFIPNPLARSLSLGTHKSVGFLLPQDITQTFSNPYIYQVIKGIGTVCQDNGYTLTIIPPLHNSIPEAVKNATVDGIITMGFFIDLGISDILRQRHLPVVSIDGESDSNTPSVTIDDEEAAFVQMTAVLENGHRNIALVSLPHDAFYKDVNKKALSVQKRKQGYIKALKQYNLNFDDNVCEYQTGVSHLDGVNIGNEILEKESKPTAIVTMSDIVALGIMQSIKDHGLVPGKDISIVGFDGIKESEIVTPPLATISQPGVQKGMMAASLLFRTLNKEEISSNILMPSKFIQRDSLGRCNEH